MSVLFKLQEGPSLAFGIARAELILQFMEICSKGLVKPFDPITYGLKILELKKQGFDISQLEMCCPHSTEVRETKDLKPYIMACAVELAAVLDLRVIRQNS